MNLASERYPAAISDKFVQCSIQSYSRTTTLWRTSTTCLPPIQWAPALTNQVQAPGRLPLVDGRPISSEYRQQCQRYVDQRMPLLIALGLLFIHDLHL